MANSINGIANLNSLSMPKAATQFTQQLTENEEASFQKLFLDSITTANSLGQSAQTAITQGITGGDVTQVEVFSAVKKADLAMRMALQIRNKVLEAYNEIKQMRIS